LHFYFKNMIEKLVLTLTKHAVWGYILQPALVSENTSSSLLILEIVNSKSSFFPHLSDSSKTIVLLSEKISDKSLMKSYSTSKNIADFHKKVTDEMIVRYIRPNIEIYHRKIIDILSDSRVSLYLRDGIKTRVLYEVDRIYVPKELSQVVFNFTKDSETGLRYNINMKCGNEEFDLHSKTYFGLCSEPAVLVVERRLHIFNDIDINKLIPFFTKKHIDVPASSEKTYIKKFIRSCVEKYEVKSEGLDIREINPERKAVLSLENDLNMLPTLFLNFKYDEKLYPADSPSIKNVLIEERDGKVSLSWFYPDKKWENELTNSLLEGGLEKTGINNFSKKKDDEEETTSENSYSLIDWIRTHQDLLSKFDLAQNLSNLNYFIGEITVNTHVETKQDWFDVRCEAFFGEFRIPFGRFRSNILNNIREFVLPDGTIAILPQEWFSRYYEMMLFSKKSDEKIRLKKHHYRIVDSIQGKDQQSFSFLTEKFDLIDIPVTLRANLRNYQQIGFSWLVRLFENNFGGCLADDMGLGKTVQTIALLQHIETFQKRADLVKVQVPVSVDKSTTTTNEEFNGQLSLFDEYSMDNQGTTSLPTLIVMPTSLIHNWQNELRRFAPNLKVYVYTGVKRLKSIDINRVFRFYNVVLTTYGTLRNDIKLLQNCQFHHLILDESQYVKNPDSLAYKAVIQINALHKLALTGTPIENSLTDLWAQLNIVNEGMLGSYTSFRNAYINPISRNNKEKEEALQRMIQPFILRRTKDEVAPELPPLSEEIVYCDMSEEQQTCYKEEKNKLRNSLSGNLTGFNSPKAAFLTLQGLTRLRLLANHPKLMDPDYKADSGKFEQIVMRFETLKSENHKVLIFSSFVKHLRLLAEHFDKESWKYAWLSGSTAAENREKEIAKFMQDPDVNCFFISLKAGGVGLNLTAADYVFIIDPWWNPASEMQALSRAHRIGQDKNVMVYRFISSETIEEKIRNLQESKTRLAETFISSTNPLKNLSEKELAELID